MRKNLLLGTLTLLLVVVAVEIGFRVLTVALWPEYTASAIRDRMAALAQTAYAAGQPGAQHPSAPESIHPYFGYVAKPGTGMAEKSYPVTPQRLAIQVGPGRTPWWYQLKANNWGFWSPYEMPYQREEGDFVLVVLGGSVAKWLALQGGETLQNELTRRVVGLADRNVVILNFGMTGFKQPQQVQVLAYLLGQGMQPDAVVNIDGFNEAGIAYHNAVSGMSPDYPRVDLWPFLISGLNYSSRVLGLLGEQFAEKRMLGRRAACAARWSRFSNVVGFLCSLAAERSAVREQSLYAQLQGAIAEDAAESMPFAARGPAADLPQEERVRAIVRIWVDGSRTLAALAAAREIAYLHVLQPVLHDSTSGSAKRLTPGERRIAATRIGAWGVWAEGVEKIYPRFRDQNAALHESGVAFVDMSGLFATNGDSIFYDISHYNQEGNEILARAIAGELAAELARPDRHGR